MSGFRKHGYDPWGHTKCRYWLLGLNVGTLDKNNKMEADRVWNGHWCGAEHVWTILY